MAVDAGQDTEVDEQTIKRVFNSRIYLGVIAFPSIVNLYSSGGRWLMTINWVSFGYMGARILLHEQSVHAERYLLSVFVFAQANGIGYILAKRGSVTECTMGNGAKAQQKRERNKKSAGAAAKSQLKQNEMAKNVMCNICRNTFLCTVKEKE
ncbi:hypothetical protein BX667DRAFT_507198 [Coemansia mojavensis]|nr:hypothetical protein BX667DRAFT_507198 [Coemansia mojavensis]